MIVKPSTKQMYMKLLCKVHNDDMMMDVII